MHLCFGLCVFWLIFWNESFAGRHGKHGSLHRHSAVLSDDSKRIRIPDPEPGRVELRQLELPQIQYLKITSRVQSRFATTLVTSRVGNPNNSSCEANFIVQLPEAAFISNFSMQIGGKVIVGTVKEKDKAKQEYEHARSLGQSAGLVAQSPRKRNVFQISVNVGAFDKVTFNLTYQEILERVHGVYKHIINIQPGQVVNDLTVEVFIAESTEISLIRVSEFAEKTGEKNNRDLLNWPEAKDVEIRSTITPQLSSAHVIFKPDRLRQKSGLSGQLVVLYDVRREYDAGEIQVVNGYFVHFFAPSGLTEGKKHVIFVLDKSGSMEGRKMRQTKEAMRIILEDLNEADHFNVLKFSDSVEFWKQESVTATKEEKALAIEYINAIQAVGGTNINEAIQSALKRLVDSTTPALAKVIIFLTDGKATVGEQRNDVIIKNVMETNVEMTISVHSVGFGASADFHLLQKLSAKNNGLARKVYEDSDAVLQLQGFYAEISKLMLTNVKVEYINETVEPGSLIQDHSYSYYDGSEFVIVGKLRRKRDIEATVPGRLEANIVGRGAEGQERFRIVCPIPRPDSLIIHGQPEPTPSPVGSVGGFVERMWAYMSIKKLLKEANFLENNMTKVEELENRALKLSLKYNFVTELTSMVVIQPDQDNGQVAKTLTGDANSPDEMVSMHRRTDHRGPLGSRSRSSYRSHAYGLPPNQQMVYRRKMRPAAPRRMIVQNLPSGRFKLGLHVPVHDLNMIQVDKKLSSHVPAGSVPLPESKPVKLTECIGENEFLDYCGAQCQETCHTHYYGRNVTCSSGCSQAACGCKKGFLRHNGLCIEPGSCPFRNCQTNQTMVSECFYDCENRCGSAPKWEEDCPVLCMALGAKCVCNRGFVKNDTGQCVAEADCPAKAPQPPCSTNETLNACGNGCERQCSTVYKTLVCPMECEGPPVCKCNRGLVRLGTSCVEIKDCPSVCQANEHFTPCGPNSEKCESVCGEATIFDESCDMCGDAGCVCDDGYIRDSVGGECVSVEMCDAKPSGILEAEAEALLDSREFFEDSMLMADMCEDQCPSGCKRIFDSAGCGSCYCTARDSRACDVRMCPGHCDMVENGETGCWDCRCSEDDRKLVYFLRLPIRSSLVNAISAHVCVDFDISEKLETFFSTANDIIQAKMTSVSRNNKIWATLKNIVFTGNFTDSDGSPKSIEMLEETLEQCACAEESITLSKLNISAELEVGTGLFGNARRKIEQSELLFDDTDAELLPKFAQIVYRPNERERKIIATRLVTRVDPVRKTKEQCYNVPYVELNL